MSTFSVDLANFGQTAIDNAERITRKVVFDIHSRIVRRMPVDTGRARANTQISINTLPSGSTLEVDVTGHATIASGDRELSRFELGDTAFIYNNVEYILALEYGSSDQAPQGMFRISFEEIAGQLQRGAV